MALRRVTIEMPSEVLVRQGVVPRVFFDHNESVEILRVCAFQPRERLLLVRVLRSGPRRTGDELLAARDRLRRRYHLRDFEILRVEDGGRAYISLLRQRNPGVLETLLEEFGAGVTPTTPSVIGGTSPRSRSSRMTTRRNASWPCSTAWGSDGGCGVGGRSAMEGSTRMTG